MKNGLPAAVLLALCGACAPAAAPAPLPPFAMSAVEPDGERPFGREQLLGRVWVVDFIFTRCSGPCPLLSERMRALAAALPPEIGLLTVTVDPEADTPERLRRYARAWGAEPGRWVFARGSGAETYRLLYEGFRLPLSVDPSAPAERRATHSARLVLLDARASVRGYYDAFGELDQAALARDARRLMETDS